MGPAFINILTATSLSSWLLNPVSPLLLNTSFRCLNGVQLCSVLALADWLYVNCFWRIKIWQIWKFAEPARPRGSGALGGFYETCVSRPRCSPSLRWRAVFEVRLQKPLRCKCRRGTAVRVATKIKKTHTQ